MESRTASSRGVASTCRGSSSSSTNSLNQVPALTGRRPHRHAHRKVCSITSLLCCRISPYGGHIPRIAVLRVWELQLSTLTSFGNSL